MRFHPSCGHSSCYAASVIPRCFGKGLHQRAAASRMAFEHTGWPMPAVVTGFGLRRGPSLAPMLLRRILAMCIVYGRVARGMHSRWTWIVVGHLGVRCTPKMVFNSFCGNSVHMLRELPVWPSDGRSAPTLRRLASAGSHRQPKHHQRCPRCNRTARACA